MREPLTLGVGFSPCPNDTFMFHGLVSGDVKVEGVRFQPVIEDIEALNLRAIEGRESLAITKLSVPALAEVTDRYALLQSGAALGRGVGPLVVRRRDRDELKGLEDLVGRRIAIPGRYTTANLLLRIFVPGEVEVEEMRFDRIMTAVQEGAVDAGVVIHEGRFSYGQRGLINVRDLGEEWEESSGLPLPLGVIAIRRELGNEVAERVEAGLRTSIEGAFADPERRRVFIRQHAQELSDEMCDQHIALYVNQYSVDMGEEGRSAVNDLLVRGRASRLLPQKSNPWL